MFCRKSRNAQGTESENPDRINPSNGSSDSIRVEALEAVKAFEGRARDYPCGCPPGARGYGRDLWLRWKWGVWGWVWGGWGGWVWGGLRGSNSQLRRNSDLHGGGIRALGIQHDRTSRPIMTTRITGSFRTPAGVWSTAPPRCTSAQQSGDPT